MIIVFCVDARNEVVEARRVMKALKTTPGFRKHGNKFMIVGTPEYYKKNEAHPYKNKMSGGDQE